MVSGRDFLGAYRLVRIVRSGQTCQVWESVKDPDPNRLALKVLLQEHVKKKDQIALLQHEAEVGKPLDNKYCIKIYEFSSQYSLPFVAMELYNAKNIKQLIRENPDQMAYHCPNVIRRCAKGLSYLNKQGWVHCDVKPDNFLVNVRGKVKLIDFAIAQKIRRKGGLASLFSRKGTISGTRSYMSPEQIRGKGLDERADVYSFGCTIYEMLTGKLPFSGINPDDLLSKHLRASIPNACTTNRTITPEMGELVAKMMAKNPDDRPQNFDAFLNEYKKVNVYRAGMRPEKPEDVPD